MNARWNRWGRVAAAVGAAGIIFTAATLWAQRPSTERHVRELGRYLDGVKIAEPVRYGQLAVYPVLVDDVPLLRGRWLTADAAISGGVLVVSEKPGGSVPLVQIENRSRDEYVFLMRGEVLAGGMQTRTVRQDVVLAPGQKIDLNVFCVEARRWSGNTTFSAGSKTMVPQSIQKELRGGADQQKVWSEVTRNNAALKAENATGNLDEALQAAPVKKTLDDVRRRIVPAIPRGTTGFIFVDHGRALGLELFGSEDLARPAAQAAGFLCRGLRDPQCRGRGRRSGRQWRGHRPVRAALPRGQPAGEHPRLRLRHHHPGVAAFTPRPAGRRGEPRQHAGPLRRQFGGAVPPAPEPRPVIIYPNRNPEPEAPRRHGPAPAAGKMRDRSPPGATAGLSSSAAPALVSAPEGRQ